MSKDDLFIKPKSSEDTIINPYSLEKCWFVKDNTVFKQNFVETYKPDIWFSGEERKFVKEVVSSIENAKELIILSSFILQKTDITDALLRISKSNVRIYIITASENLLENLATTENEHEGERIREHIELLRTLKDRCLIRTAHHFHAKYILIDPRTENRVGYFSSANFTERALSENVEAQIKLNATQIVDIFNLSCQKFWFESEHEYIGKTSLKSVKEIQKSIFEFPEIKKVFCPNQKLDFQETLLDLIKTTKGDIILSTFSIESNTPFFNLLLQELKNGRKIFIFIRPKKKDLGALFTLWKAGAYIKGHPLLHFKCLLINSPQEDKGVVFTGNLTQESFKDSYDIGFFLNSKQIGIFLSVLNRWKEIMPAIFIGTKDVKDLETGIYWKWTPNKTIFTITENEIIDLGIIEGKTIENFRNDKPKLEFPLNKRETVKKIVFKWTSVPPKIPQRAKLITTLPKDIPEEFEVYIKNKKLYKIEENYFLIFAEGDNYEKLKKVSKSINAEIRVK